jgi:DNA-binding beta-propeller fold protein YncE
VTFDGTDIWVGNYGDGTVSKLRARDGTVLGTFKAGVSPYGIAFDGVNIWIASAFQVLEMRPSDGKLLLVARVTQGDTTGLAFDGANIWVARYAVDLVSKL